MTTQETIDRIRDLRLCGFSWKEVEVAIFPTADIEHHPHKSWVFAKKHKIAGAFEKQVIGCFTPCQTVVKLRDKAPMMAS